MSDLTLIDVGLKLVNFAIPELGIQFKHPYRFVFLDGCETAFRPFWRDVFGIPERITLEDLTRSPSVYFDHPQAFVGWTTPTPYPEDVEWNDYGETLGVFFSEWMLGSPLAECITAASDRNSTGPLTGQLLKRPLPRAKNRDLWEAKGDPHWRAPGVGTSFGYIKWYGYVGITAHGYDPNY